MDLHEQAISERFDGAIVDMSMSDDHAIYFEVAGDQREVEYEVKIEHENKRISARQFSFEDWHTIDYLEDIELVPENMRYLYE